MSGQVGYYEQFLISGTKRGILYGKQKHDPCGRPGKAEQRGCDLQSARGILYQSDRGAGDWKNFGAGLQYDPGCDKAVCGIDVCRKKFKDGYSGDREGDPGAVFCADAKASDRVYEGRVQPVSHGNRGELSAEEELRRLKRCRNV